MVIIRTLEQIGTDSDISKGVPTYYAWYEFYPSQMHSISSITVKPGDVINAEVSYSGTTFRVTITDTTTGGSYTTTGTVSSAQRSSAEWIAEAPTSMSGVLPLANFGTAKFGTDNTGVNQTCYATINGQTLPIGGFGTSSTPGTSIDEITMVAKRGGGLKAQPTALSPDDTSFTVKWYNTGP